MRSVEKAAKTREEALTEALQELGVSISDVDVEVLEEGSKGLFGLFGSRPCRIRVTLKGGSDSGENELDVMSLLADSKPEKKPERKPEKKQEPRQEKKPEPRPEKKPEPKAQPEEETSGEVKGEAKKENKRPQPVRRVNPEKKQGQEAQSAEETEKPENTGTEAGTDGAEKKSSRRSRSRKPKQPREAEQEKQPAEKKALPPKKQPEPVVQPVLTAIPEEELTGDTPAGRAKDFLQEITRLMGVDVQIAMSQDQDGNVYAAMTGDTIGVLIGRRGETLDALQYLTSLKVNRNQEHYTRVTLDTENYRAKREDTLVRLANRMANRAVKSGRKVALEPMNPYERRIIHSALQPNEAVDTHSEGDEPNRHVVITVRKP